MTKQQLVKTAQKNGILSKYSEFDYSLPQEWLDEISREVALWIGEPAGEVYNNIRSNTVWGYGITKAGEPVVISENTAAIIAARAYHAGSVEEAVRALGYNGEKLVSGFSG